jgi:hypothetical protein
MYPSIVTDWTDMTFVGDIASNREGVTDSEDEAGGGRRIADTCFPVVIGESIL